MAFHYKVKYYDLGRDIADKFRISGCTFNCALNQIFNYLDATVGEDEYEILSIKVEHIVNEGHECQSENSVEGEFVVVKCSNPKCGFENHIPLGLNETKCIKCGERIEVPEPDGQNGDEDRGED
jgi:hypothetical protein